MGSSTNDTSSTIILSGSQSSLPSPTPGSSISGKGPSFHSPPLSTAPSSGSLSPLPSPHSSISGKGPPIHSPPHCTAPSSSPTSARSSASCWAHNITIPSRFSRPTMKCIEEGILTSASRDEVVNSLSTLMMLHTVTPTSTDYTIVCERLVKAIPCLKDCVGSGYVSIYLSLLTFLSFNFIYSI